MIEYVYAVELFDDEGHVKYELIKEKIVKETQESYIIRGFMDLPKSQAFITPESAIESYRNKLRELLTRHEASVMDAKVSLAAFECTFQDQIIGLPESEEELEHAERHQLLYDHFQELVTDWFDHNEDAKQRGTILNLEQWAKNQTDKLDHQRH